MGQAPRLKPKRLAKKLKKIRECLGLSQNELIARMGLNEVLTQNNISAYERGTREPSLVALLHYAKAAGICVDVLIDDKLDLPADIPSSPKHTASIGD
jgi:transcriptional regulator with XRE-family HTH domain